MILIKVGGIIMGVKDTKVILEKHMKDPLKVCRYFLKYFPSAEEEKLYKHFRRFGMYTYNARMEENLQQLIEDDVWYMIDDLFMKYQSKWKGPDIPIFIIPHRNQTWFSKGQNKSGLAFGDKMFLFVSPKMEQKQLEALFIHEYHHVCRLRTQKKEMDEYTLLESCVMEGLAEYTVQRLMGAEYLAPWTKQYSAKFLHSFWNKYLEKNVDIQKREKQHDFILYGNGKLPYMGGYSMGFYLVELFADKHPFTIKQSFSLSATDIKENYKAEK